MPIQTLSPPPSFAPLDYPDVGNSVYLPPQYPSQPDSYGNTPVHHPNRFIDIANNVVPPAMSSATRAYQDRPVHLRNGQFMVPSSTVPAMHNLLGHPRASPFGTQQIVRAQTVSTVPPSRAHKVWILDCKACGTFLTNRGMKAVLLLRPNVPLYSTDAPPVNCSAYSPPPSPSDLPVSESSPLTPTFTASDAIPARLFALPPPPSTRTCECLTQTLHCHTCGGSVGYTIVAPCARCTAPTATHRGSATNGHRFVFYASDVLAEERAYVHGERGVVPFHPQWQLPAMYAVPLAQHPALPVAHAALRSSEASATPHMSSGDRDGDPPSFTNAVFRPAQPLPVRESDRLRTGDIVFWHNLVRSGEIPAVTDDARGRGGRGRSQSVTGAREVGVQPGGRKGGDAACAQEVSASQAIRRRQIFAGR